MTTDTFSPSHWSEHTAMELSTPTSNSAHPSRKHFFGYMSGLTQQVGSFDYGQYLMVDLYHQTGRIFQLDGSAYQTFVEVYQHTTIQRDQWLYIELTTDQDDQVLSWRLVQLPFLLDYAHVLMQGCYQRHLLLDVFDFIQKLQLKPLQSFMWALFSRWDLARAFIANPASYNHHHAYPGGLLEHSLECLHMVQAALEGVGYFAQAEKDLTCVAALLHDLGKTQTLNASGQLTPEGHRVDHEHYTLSLMHEELKQLKRSSPQTAIALEYLLTWKVSDGYPQYIGASLIKAVDRVSTALQLRENAFLELPDYYHFTHFKAGKQTLTFSRVN